MNLLGKKTGSAPDVSSAPMASRKSRKKLFFALGAVVVVLALIAVLFPRGGGPGETEVRRIPLQRT